MMVPLSDSKDNVRYFLGAQVDVSGLLKDTNSLESIRKLLTNKVKPEDSCKPTTCDRLQAMKELSLMLETDELDLIRQRGGSMKQGTSHLHDTTTLSHKSTTRSRIFLHGNDEDFADDDKEEEDNHLHDKRFIGIYQNVRILLTLTTHTHNLSHIDPAQQQYLVVRPAPSLRILFASPSLRAPDMLQSHLLQHIGGSAKIRVDLERSLQKGNAVTAGVHWLMSESDRCGEGGVGGCVRWLHCTPLLHHSGAVGAWVIIVVDEVDDTGTRRRPSG